MATVQQVQNVTRRMSEEKATVLAREAVELSRAGHKDVSPNYHMFSWPLTSARFFWLTFAAGSFTAFEGSSRIGP